MTGREGDWRYSYIFTDNLGFEKNARLGSV
jgi:hypothetical protein